MKKNSLKMSLVALLIGSSPVHANTLMDFDFSNDNMSVPSHDFKYVPKGESCNGSSIEKGKLCTPSGDRIHLYYSPYTSDHMGYMRYGSIYSESSRSTSGRALGITLTGGRYHNSDGELVESGAPIKDMYDLNDALANRQSDLFSNEDELPGWAAMYYNGPTTTTPIKSLHGANRFNVWVWYPASTDRYARFSREAKDANAPKKTLSLYPFIDDSRGNHYYHHATNRGYGGWIKASFDAHPTHNNAVSGEYNYGFPVGGYHSPGDGVDYFNRMVAFALVFDETKNTASPYTFSTDDWTTELKQYENDETVANLAIGYDSYYRKFDVSFEDKYRCGTCNAEYEITYSFSPINNDNIEETTTVKSLENFFIEDDNDEKIIKKPNPGYNQIWANFKINDSDLSRFHSGDTIYFAVRDKTVRAHEVDPIDNVEVTIPSGKVIKTKDLVKTISYEYHGNNWEFRIEGESDISTTANYTGDTKLKLSGIPSSFELLAIADPGLEASINYKKGYDYNNGFGELVVKSETPGKYNVSVESRRTNGELVARKSIAVYVDELDCRVLNECTKETLVNFHHSDKASSKPNELWQDIFMNRYTSYSDGGVGTVVGSNGSYNYQGIKGSAISFGPNDVVQFSILNKSGVGMTVDTSISSNAEGSITAGGDWLALRPQHILAGERRYWNIPIKDFAQSTLSSININVANDTQHLRLEEISIITEGKGVCSSCKNVLVDFFPNADGHLLPVSGWDTVLMDNYTGNINGGAAIVVGSNNAYNHQGIKGTTLQPASLTFEWFNTSKYDYTFSPMISFDDIDKPTGGATGSWLTLPPVFLPALSRAESTIDINGPINMINTNFNVLQPGHIALDKITYD